MLKQKYSVSFDHTNGSRRTEEFISISKRKCRDDVKKKYPDAKRIEVTHLDRGMFE